MAKRRDANHRDVIRAFEAYGWTVADTADLGDGFPDVLIAKGGVMRQVEIKDGSKPLSARKLTPAEQRYHARLAAAGCPVLVIDTIEQVTQWCQERAA